MDNVENFPVYLGQNIMCTTLNEIIGFAAVCTLILLTKTDCNEVLFLFSLRSSTADNRSSRIVATTREHKFYLASAKFDNV